MSDWDRYGSETEGQRTAYEQGYRGEDAARGLRGRARQGIEEVSHSAQEVGGRARQGFDHYFHQHPLLFGAGAFALGVAIGMLLPSSRPEERWLGEASHRVRERTREAAGKVGEVAKASLREARETARSEMEARGLDTQSLREGAEGAVHEVREVAEKTAQEARRAAEEEAERNKLR
jgi:ElaB/YqjD/DUF883 family membrane-anchored ribosome-binding protein